MIALQMTTKRLLTNTAINISPQSREGAKKNLCGLAPSREINTQPSSRQDMNNT
jgi:hypothetical protein